MQEATARKASPVNRVATYRRGGSKRPLQGGKTGFDRLPDRQSGLFDPPGRSPAPHCNSHVTSYSGHLEGLRDEARTKPSSGGRDP
jgi:hypothetical protein